MKTYRSRKEYGRAPAAAQPQQPGTTDETAAAR